MDHARCPSDEDLGRLLRGELPEPQAGPLERHFAGCPACGRRAAAMDGGADHPAHAATAWPAGPVVEGMIRELAEVPVSWGEHTPTAVGPHYGGGPPLPSNQWAVRGDTADPAFVPDVPGYEILDLLGRGGMGMVYKARQIKADRVVALKMIRVGGDASADGRVRFRTEAESVARLAHPNIVQVYEVGESDRRPFFSMEFCAGGSLDRKLNGVPVPPTDAARLVENLARAVQAAHDRGVLHRDLKPGNILLTADGTPKVTDFGLAKKLDDDSGQTHTGAIMGTPSYMAPEQAAGQIKEVGREADTYSLGAVLYECLTGRPPFRGATLTDTLLMVRLDDPVPPTRLQRGVSRDLETVCLKCLRKEPGRRYASAGELADDLGRFLRHEPVRARPVGRMEGGWRWCRRNPAVAGLLGAVAATLLLGAAVSTFYAFEAERQRRDAVAQTGEADTQRREAERQREEANTQKALAEENEKEKDGALQRTRSALKAAQLLRAELVGAADPQAGFLLLCDEKVWPTAERDFAWRVHNHWCQRTGERTGLERATLRGHTKGIGCVRMSPDGKTLATVGMDHTIKLWDAESGTPRATFPGPAGYTDYIHNVCFSPDGKTLASGSADKTVKLWNVETGEVRTALEGHSDWVRSVCFSPDGTTLASSGSDGDATIKLWDAATGKERTTLRGHAERVWSVCFSPDGTTIASAGRDLSVKLWDARTGSPRTLAGHTSEVYSVCFSPNGKTLASASADGTIRLWDARTGAPQGSLRGHEGWVHCVCFTPDGATIASAGHDKTIKLWDATTGQEHATLKGHTDAVMSVVFSPNGKTLASAGEDKTIKLWDTRPGQERATLSGSLGVVASVAFRPDGKTLASGSGGGRIHVWDAETWLPRAPLEGHTSEIYKVVYSPDGETIASSSDDTTVKLWDAGTGQVRATLGELTGADRGLCFGRDGTLLASNSRVRGKPDEIKIWDLAAGRERLALKSHTAGITSLCFSPNGKTLASASEDMTLKLWDTQTGHNIFTLDDHKDVVNFVVFSPDGETLASASGAGPPGGSQTPGPPGEIKLRDGRTGTARTTLKGHAAPVFCVAFRPDGRTLASASGDRTIKLWDVRTGRELATLRGHKGAVLAVCFSPDGKTLASGGVDGTVKLWDVPPLLREH